MKVRPMSLLMLMVGISELPLFIPSLVDLRNSFAFESGSSACSSNDPLGVLSSSSSVTVSISISSASWTTRCSSPSIYNLTDGGLGARVGANAFALRFWKGLPSVPVCTTEHEMTFMFSVKILYVIDAPTFSAIPMNCPSDLLVSCGHEASSRA